ncbi:DEAD/DEAH box helicase family protein [Mycobacterium ulcerans]|uniref:DEAD/DEAH box helicase family protein n=1 Tax=Mycobacterium ulcerans TaxID=1809 RepID=UPI001F06BC18|nr:DEAD/DEAH box helicase family protein [Mycobacterium ulcerans]
MSPATTTPAAGSQHPHDPTAATAEQPAKPGEQFRSVTDFAASTEILVPSGPKARARANLAAIELVNTLHDAQRPATLPEQRILAAWSGWGALPAVFDPRNNTFAAERSQLATLLTPEQYRHAHASILNAHYTDPAIAAVIVQALGAAGFAGGRVLEPGCGSGTFIAHAPPNATMIGVEADDITATIAALLYPSAQVRHEGFETTRVPDASFAAAIGNVPFGKYALTDPTHNPRRHSIHNHFIIKSLNLVAPGGYVAVLTSRYTMDSARPTARQDIASQADLIAALRLPSQAFTRVAATHVVTDLLIFRRRTPSVATTVDTLDWINTEPIAMGDPNNSTEEHQIPINSYFAANPYRVLGAMELGRGLHGTSDLVVTGASGHQLADQLHQQLHPLIAAAVARGHGLTARPADLTACAPTAFTPGLRTHETTETEPPPYSLRYNAATDSIDYWTGSRWEPNKTPRTLIEETKELIALRDVATQLIAAQRDNNPKSERDQLRAHLNTLYDNYLHKRGPLNRFEWIRRNATEALHDKRIAKLENAWRQDEGMPGRPYDGPIPDELAQKWETQAWEPPEPFKKHRHLEGGMRYDPGWAEVSALEIFDDATQAARKAPIFTADLLTAEVERSSVDTPEEALAISIERTRGVDINLISALLDTNADHAHALLDGLVYPSLTNPDELVPATTALSGNVRAKLAAAIEAADTNAVYEPYVHALREVQPQQRQAEAITVRPGAPWIPATIIAAFAEQTFGVTDVVAEHIGGHWTVDVAGYQRHGRLMTDEWGLARRRFDAVSLLETVCNSKAVVIRDDESGDLDTQATIAAQAKCAKITEEFTRWLWSDDQRRDTLVAEYNRRFNCLRAPVYDGTHLQLPGLSDHFTPHPYQRHAVARIINEPATLLDHVVGAGKTGSMVMAATELRRLGLVRQPWIVVPNHIIEQVGREAKQWYPAARVLLGSAATTAEGRRRFVAQSAASDWDIVVVPQSAFKKINVSDDTRAAYIEDELDQLRTQLENSDVERTQKAIMRAIKTTDERLQKLLAPGAKDAGLRFEQTGCDYLVIDEAHMYKNKRRLCNIAELSYTESADRAEDLALKLDILRRRRHDEARARGIADHEVVERVATFATGTPIANSLGELWVMQQYLRPDLLKQAGVHHIDDWAAAFTTTHSTIEVNATGTKLRPITRVGKYANLPELLALTDAYTDTVTRDQVPAALPELRTGTRHIISLQPETEVVDFIADLGWRADHLDPRKPRLDNILKISSDGRRASLDPRLVHLGAPQHGRAAEVASQAIRIHRRHADRQYRDPDTEELQPLRGGLQIMFCDLGTPSTDPNQFTIYQAIKDELVARGMPETKVRFVHEARNATQLKALFAQCNRGEVSVLIGSTEKMGTGTNVQARLTALHHVDVPWRPSDLEQREGRIMRQGNQNSVVDILIYVAQASYDTVIWQKVQAKALFIDQMRRREVADTEIEDLDGGDIGSAAAETKAVATGDPRYLRQVELDDSVRRLTALQRAHQQSARNRDYQVRSLENAIPAKQTEIDQLTPVAHSAAAHTDATHRITIGADTFTDRPAAAAVISAQCRRAYIAGKDRGASRYDRPRRVHQRHRSPRRPRPHPRHAHTAPCRSLPHHRTRGHRAARRRLPTRR